MSRAIGLALAHIEVRRLALPRFERWREAVVRAVLVEPAASALYARNQAIRSSTRGWMI